MTTEEEKRHDAILGCLLGTAVGDSIGLPFEGIQPARAERMNRGGAKHHFLFGRGMFSDDTEHTLMVANALALHQNDCEAFEKQLAKSLRWWMAALPAGVGLSTARAIFKLWIGFPTTKSGVYSAGNGTAMRSAIIGATFCNDAKKRNSFVVAGSLITHTDPRATEAAVIVAEATACACNGHETDEIIAHLQSFVESQEMKEGFKKIRLHLNQESTVRELAAQIGKDNGISGFAPETVTIALFAWLRYREDFRSMIDGIISCGGDTDTGAAIAGGIAGAECLEAGIPDAWISGICDWPRSIASLRKTADSLALGTGPKAGTNATMALVPFRNIFFLIVVLFHGFRRLLPPY